MVEQLFGAASDLSLDKTEFIPMLNDIGMMGGATDNFR